MIKVLMIEDDLELAEVLAKYLKKFDIDVDIAEEPFIGLSMLEVNSYELLILDLTLPGLDGLELIPKIREKSDIPIIISSARDDILDKVMGLERGADDYLPKPYNPRELEARIKTILRRKVSIGSSTQESKKDKIFDLNEDAMQIRFKGELLQLTPAEYDILSMLIKNKGGVVSRDRFLYESENIDDDSSLKNIDVMVSRIRSKISKIDSDFTYIKPARGIGYQLVLP
jgi:two-component system OmpR family response regulator